MTPATIVHDALLYDSEEAYLSALVPFLREGIAAGEGTVVATNGPNRKLLADALGPQSKDVLLVDSADVYRTPQAAVAAYHQVIGGFLSEGRPSVRAVGEVAYPSTVDAQQGWLVYEPVAHSAFADVPLHVICPYDRRVLPAALIDHAQRTHQHVHEDALARPSPTFQEPGEALRSLPDVFPLAIETAPDVAMEVGAGGLGDARRSFAELVGRHLSSDRAEEAALVITELLTNGLRHGSGSVGAEVWLLPGGVVCEVRNEGPPIEDPIAGYRPPNPAAGGGMGLWIVRQLVDAMHVGRSERGPVVRFALTA